MKAETLKKAILQYAMQGKLVEQNPADEPASVLLERIKADKEQLIKDGKIKKEKPLPPITEDEIPYELPKGWELIRFNEVYKFIDYRGKTPNKLKTGIPLITAKNIKQGFNDYKIAEYISEKEFKDRQSRGISKIGDILFTTEAPMGNVSIADMDIYSTGQRVICMQQYNVNVINNKFIMYYLLSEQFQSLLNNKQTGTTVSGIKAERLKLLPLLIPPLTEQERIVEKLEQILPLVEEYGKNEEKLSKLNSTLPDKIKQSILQHAVQGKLVPQNPSDEPASELLKRIKAEKEQLIKEGKIKKEKPLPPITEDEIPFQIPDSWEWVKLGDLCSINPRNIAEDDLDVGFIPMTRINDGYLGGHTYENKKWKDVKSGFTHFQTGDVVVAKITPCFQNRKSTIISDIPNKIGAGTTELHVIRDNTRIINMRYLLLSVKTEMFIREGVKNFTGTAGQQRVGKDYIMNYIVPLPPLAEQQRIVTKVEELLAVVDKLKG